MDIELVGVPSQPILNSIFIPFTRKTRQVQEFLEMLSQAEIDFPPLTEMIFYNDTDDNELQDLLRDYLRGTWRGPAKLIMTGVEPLGEIGDLALVNKRRERIIKMRFNAQEVIGPSHYTYLLEDDTFFPANALLRLKTALTVGVDPYTLELPRPGLVSGLEAGRWAFKHLGAWRVDNLENPKEVRSLVYQFEKQESGYLEDVEGTGMYCLITYTSLYKQATFRNEAEALGPDVLYGLDLKRQGYMALVDWGIPCEHRDIFGHRLLPRDATQEVIYEKKNRQWTSRLVPIIT